jgi:hypothetical protein
MNWLHYGFCWLTWLPSFLKQHKNGGLLSLAPEYNLEENGHDVSTNRPGESTLDLTVILHGTTQTRCIALSKATDNTLITPNNISWQFLRSFTIV